MDEKSIEELHRCEYPECMETVVEDEHKCSEHLSNKYDSHRPADGETKGPEINSMPKEVQDVAHFLHSHCGEKDLSLWLRVLGEEMDGLNDYVKRRDQHGPDNFCDDCFAGEDGEWAGCKRNLTPCAVTILVGIPGAGKSFAAKRLTDEDLILSTDDFWIDDDGNYNFDPKRITEAHGWTFQRFLRALSAASADEFPHIVIDNTNTTIAEIAPYYAAAQSFGADVKVLAILCPWQVAAERQTHGLPGAKVYQMSLRLEETLRSFPSWWDLDVADNTPHPDWTPSL